MRPTSAALVETASMVRAPVCVCGNICRVEPALRARCSRKSRRRSSASRCSPASKGETDRLAHRKPSHCVTKHRSRLARSYVICNKQGQVLRRFPTMPQVGAASRAAR